jgi:hypothetical protein
MRVLLEIIVVMAVRVDTDPAYGSSPEPSKITAFVISVLETGSGDSTVHADNGHRQHKITRDVLTCMRASSLCRGRNPLCYRTNTR